MKRAGITGRVPILTIGEINREMDISFTELGYAAGKWPYTIGWREEGATSAMAFDFCKRRSSVGEAVNCIMLHNDHKIQEYISEKAYKDSPTIVFGVFSDHAYGYKDGKQVASQKAISGEGDRDEYHAKRIREPYQHEDRPAFSEWWRAYGRKIQHEENEVCWDEIIYPGIMEEMQDGFLNLVEAAPEKRRRTTTQRGKIRGTIYYYAEFPLDEYVHYALKAIEALKGTDRCFSFNCMYGNDPSSMTSIHFFGNGTPRLIIQRVPTNADYLNHIATV